MIFFVTPMILIVILYLKIMRNIRESVNAAGYSTNRDLIYVHLKQIEWRRQAVTFIRKCVLNFLRLMVRNVRIRTFRFTQKSI